MRFTLHLWVHWELHMLCIYCTACMSFLSSLPALLTGCQDNISSQSQFSFPIQTILTSHLLFPLPPGSTLFSGHPGVSDWSGRNWSNDQNLSRHCQASPWWLPADGGDASLCFSALLSTTPRLSGCPQGEAIWWVNRMSLSVCLHECLEEMWNSRG